MRILDRASLVSDLAALGFVEESVAPFLAVLDQPHGILLVTGPTGSGKTTTLYTCLQRLNTPEKKLFTVEDPVEYQLDGVNQIQIKPQIGLTFAHVLRSHPAPGSRHHHDRRDPRPRDGADRASRRRSPAISCCRRCTPTAPPRTVTRLLDMGIEDYLVTSTITGVLAQRLVRKLCAACREPYVALPELVAQLRLAEAGRRGRAAPRARLRGLPRHRLSRPRRGAGIPGDERRHPPPGAAPCRGGRDPSRRRRAEGMRSMYEDGLRKALLGATSLEEVLRVTRDVGA